MGCISYRSARGKPFLATPRASSNQLVSGFEFSPTVIFQSGLPFTVSFSGCGADLPGDAPCYVNGSSSSLHTGKSGAPGAGLLGKTMLKKGDPIAAVTYLDRAEQMDPANYITHSLLGQAYRVMGRSDDAARETETAQKLQTASEPKIENTH